MCALIFWTALRGSQNSSVALSQVINHGFLSTTPRQNAKVGVAHCKISPTQESENEQIQNQIDAHLFFFYSQGIVHKEFVPLGQTVNQTFYREVFERLKKTVARVRQALHALGCCTTTAPHVTRQSPSMNFWQKKAFLWFLSPLIRRISVPVTSFYSPGSNTA